MHKSIFYLKKHITQVRLNTVEKQNADVIKHTGTLFTWKTMDRFELLPVWTIPTQQWFT